MSTHRVVLAAVLVIALLAPGASQSLAQPAAPQAAAASSTASGSMLFIENAGQWPQAARFQVWGSPLGTGTTWLAEDAIWLVVGAGEQESGSMGDVEAFSPSPSPQTALKLTFPGSNPDVQIEPFAPLTTTVSYFIGNDPEQWHAAVPVYGGVRYVDLYPGVDLVMGGTDGGWRLAPSPTAAVEQVRMRIEGADAASLAEDALSVNTPLGDLILTPPAATFPFSAELLDQSAHNTTFVLQPTDLWTDPIGRRASHEPSDDPSDLIYSTYLGGSPYWDQINAIAVDSVNRATVTGLTMSDVFPTTPGAFDPTFGGGTCGTSPCRDAFVSRLSADGSTLEYSTYLGGNNDDWADAIALDNVGRATVVGYASSGNFPTTPGVLDASGPGSFVTRFSADGSSLVYSTFLHACQSQAIAVDGAGQATLSGSLCVYNR